MKKVFLLCLFAATSAFPVFAAGRVTFVPAETDEIFTNPGMGWQTFNRFADDDPNLEGLPSGSAYFRLYWRELEPAEGRFNFALVDSLLARAHKAGQKLAMRIRCIGTGARPVNVPLWLLDKGCPGFEFERGGKQWAPDMDHPLFQVAHSRLIREFGKRYDGHPDLDVLDIGTVGLWGEWHMGDTGVAMPSVESRHRIIDAYLAAFPRTPKVMLINGEESLAYAIGKGCGWRADCLGDMGTEWRHMEVRYPLWVKNASAQDTWKTAPVAFETCWTMQKWKDEGWCIPCIFDYGLKYHASYINNKSAKIPEGGRPDVEKLLRRLGYRLVLRSVECGTAIKAGAPFDVSMKWENIGVAPPYFDYRLAYRLADATGGKTAALPTGISIKGWLPGSRDVTAAPIIPKGLKKGAYTLFIAVVDPIAKEPAVRLAIKGRGEDGWYALGTVEVK